MPPMPNENQKLKTKNQKSKGSSTRQQIIDLAYHLFLEKGYAATSVRDISAAAGLTMGGIYAHFSSKEDIFVAVFDAYHPFFHLVPLLLEAEGDTLEDLVQNTARRMIGLLGEQQETLRLMFVEIVEFQGRHFAGKVEAGFPEVLQIADRFQRFEGRVRPMPILALMRSFIGLFFSFFMTGLLFPSLMAMGEAEIAQFTDIYLHGIMEPHER
jgi:AcrR family transcriptional regulator